MHAWAWRFKILSNGMGWDVRLLAMKYAWRFVKILSDQIACACLCREENDEVGKAGSALKL